MKTDSNSLSQLVVAIDIDTLFKTAHADSSYIVNAMQAQAHEGSLLPYILGEGDRQFASVALADAFAHITTRLAAYIDPSTAVVGDTYNIILLLPATRPSQLDTLIAHELQRAFVTFLLSRYYELRLPEVAMRQHQLCEAAIETARHDIFMAYGGMKRRGSYI